MRRGLGQEGMEDAVSSGLFRSKQNVPDRFYPGSSLRLSKSFGTNPYFTPKFKTAATYGDNYLAEVPRDAANWTQRYKRSDWSQFADRPIPISEGRILQKDWLQGYRPINSLETPSSSKGFNSEIDWGKWNPETPKYPELMNEYNAIEESTKKAGTWMKNPDGSSFEGTPEQFVQQQSSYFKKAFPSVLKDDANNVQFTYHGSPSEFDFFDGSIMNHGRTRGHGIYTTPKVEKATGYAKEPNGKVYQLYQNAANKQDEYFKLKQASDEKFKQFLKDNPKDSQGFDKKFDDFVKEDGKTFDHLSIDEFKLRNGFDFYIAEPDEYVVPFTNYPKSAKGNVGFFDMTNPNIYKAVAPVGVGLGAGASQLQEKKYGGLQMSYLKTKRFK